MDMIAQKGDFIMDTNKKSNYTKTKHIRSVLPSQSTFILWVKAGGRCERCNRILYRDTFDKAFEYPIADKAHNVANSPDWVRGDRLRSQELTKDINNILLLCPTCHREIDRNRKRYSEDCLKKIKKEHENRIEHLTGFTKDKYSNIITCVFDINNTRTPVIENMAYEAVMNNGYFPSQQPTIELGIQGLSENDSETDFWTITERSLEKSFSQKLLPRIEKDGDIKNLSIFAIAPIPILIKLGQLLTDKPNAEIFQLHRTPKTWNWLQDENNLDFKIIPPKNTGTGIALKISLSDSISDEDIKKTIGENVAIWTLTIKEPNNDCIKSKKHLDAFKEKIKEVLREIKRVHGTNQKINVFPAMPISTAIEFGRVWMPKADLGLIIFDRNRKNNLGFHKTITIGK